MATTSLRNSMFEKHILATWLAAAAALPYDEHAAACLMTAATAAVGIVFALQAALETPNAQTGRARVLRGTGPSNSIAVFCPGLGANMDITLKAAPLHETLARHSRVLVFDYDPGATDIDHLVENALRIFDEACSLAKKNARVAIVGYSMGGAVAAYAAARLARARWKYPIHLELYAAPSNALEGIDLPTIMLVGVSLFANDLDVPDQMHDLGSGAYVRIVHALDDEVVSVEHANQIARAAALGGAHVEVDLRPSGLHALKPGKKTM